MEYNYEDITKVLEFKTWTDKRKIDELFRIDCEMYTLPDNKQLRNNHWEISDVVRN